MQLQTMLTMCLMSVILLCLIQGTEAHSKEEDYLSSLGSLEEEFGELLD